MRESVAREFIEMSTAYAKDTAHVRKQFETSAEQTQHVQRNVPRSKNCIRIGSVAICIVAVECFRIRRVRTEPIMYVGKRQPRLREGKGPFFKSRGFVGYPRSLTWG